RDGYVKPRSNAGARNRVVLGLTDTGRQAVTAWLQEPAPTYRIFDQSLAKLYFAGMVDPDAAERLLDDQRRQHADLLDEFERIRAVLESVDYDGHIPYQLYTLRLGIGVERAYLNWISATLDDMATRADNRGGR
nr:hypothetical protein [Actinomycetota bacterium]